jgi:succinyl-CoA:acetate CoA-transferase
MSTNNTNRVEGRLSELTAREAAEVIPADASVAVSGFGSVGYPKAIPLELAASDRDLALTVVSGGSVGKEIDTALVEADAIARRYPFQATPEARKAVNDGTIAFHDRHISRLGDEVRFGQLMDRVDMAVVEAIAAGPGWLVPSTSVGHTPAYVERADRLLVEVNEAQPLSLRKLHDVYSTNAPPNREPIPLTDPGERIGSPEIRFDSEKLVGVVRTDSRDDPYVFREPTETDRAIAANLTEFLTTEIERSAVFEDTVNLQFGVGSLGNALMGQLEAVDFGDRDVAYAGEVIQDGLLDLLDKEMLTAASATSLALSEDGQERLFENVERYARDIVVRPAEISNSPEVVNRLGVIGVNSALEVDIYGHVNSTHVKGTHMINGLGGSGDFNRNSLLPIVALGSTAKDGTVSRIVPFATHVDHTEHEAAVIVTEHGVADLRGLSPRERAETLIANCADPSFRPALRSYIERAKQAGGNVLHDLPTAFDWEEQA